MKKIALLLIILAASHAVAYTKPYPLGAGVVTPVRDTPGRRNGSTKDVGLANEEWTDSSGVQHNIWTDPNIQFVVVRDFWSYIDQNGNGVFDWTYFDAALALAEQNNKPVVFSIDGGWSNQTQTANYPAYLQNQGAYIWQSVDVPPLECPAPWDAIVQAQWRALITSFGANYDSHGLVIGISMWVGSTGIEAYFSRGPNDDAKLDKIAHDALGGDQTGKGGYYWESGAKVLINDFLTAFPTTHCYLACGEDYSSDNMASMTALANWWTGLAPNFNGLESDALSIKTPNNPNGYWQFPWTTLHCDSVNVIMYQYLDPINSANMLGATNYQVQKHAFVTHASATQCYVHDPEQDNEAGVIWFNSAVGL